MPDLDQENAFMMTSWLFYFPLPGNEVFVKTLPRHGRLVIRGHPCPVKAKKNAWLDIKFNAIPLTPKGTCQQPRLGLLRTGSRSQSRPTMNALILS